MSESTHAFLAGLVVGAIGVALIMTWFPNHTRIYKECKIEMFKEAYAKGYAIKEIDKDDKVIYKWK